MNILKKFRHFSADILAGATGAVAGAPQAMGFAIIAGISPIYGLYTAAVSTIVGAFTADSVFMTIGPTNAASLMVGGALLMCGSKDPISCLIALTLIVGVFQILFGVLGIGSLFRFVSNSVMTGFISGAALLIILYQLGPLVGATEGVRGNVLSYLWEWLNHLPQADPHTTIIGVLSLVVIYGLHHTRFKRIATLTAMAVSGIVVYGFGLESVALVRDMSAIPDGLPFPFLPELQLVPGLIWSGLAIAILISVQAAGITRNIPQPDGSAASVRRDLIGQGAANIVGSFFQAMPAGGSLSRTAVNINAGAKSRISNIIAGVLVAGILLLFGGLIEAIPLAALAAHLIIAAGSLFIPDAVALAWSVSLSSRVSMVITFISTLLFPLEFSVYIGVSVSLLLYLYSSASNVKVVRLELRKNTRFKETAVTVPSNSGEPLILSVSGNLYFAAVSRLAETLPLPDTLGDKPLLILRLRDAQCLGSTAVRFIQNYSLQFRSHGGKLILTGISQDVQKQLLCARKLGEHEPIFVADEEIFSATERAIEYAKKWINESK